MRRSRSSLEGEISVEVLPEPREVHGKVPLSTYGGVFGAEEPVRFTVRLAELDGRAQKVACAFSIRNYMDEEVFSETRSVELASSGAADLTLSPALSGTGRHLLDVKVTSGGASVERQVRFLKMPKLSHPRLFFTADDEPSIRERIGRYPKLFERYRDWLRRECVKQGVLAKGDGQRERPVVFD